jgi:hypothetical protein
MAFSTVCFIIIINQRINMSVVILSNNLPDMEFYADILSDSGIGAHLSFSARTESIQSTVNYFAQKRANTKEEVSGLDGTSTMVISSVGQRHRGIRPWELAQSDAWELRQKILRNQEAHKQRTVHQQQQARAYARQKQLEHDQKKQCDELALKHFQRQQAHKNMDFVVPFIPIMPVKSTKSTKSPIEVVLEDDNTAW